MSLRKEIPTPKDFSAFVVIFGYAEIGEDKTPIMALCGKKSKRSYYIPLANAHQFADSITGEPTDHLLVTAITIGRAINIGEDKYIVREIADAVVDNLPELIEMPPAPQLTQKEVMAMAEKQGLVLKLGGKTIIDAS